MTGPIDRDPTQPPERLPGAVVTFHRNGVSGAGFYVVCFTECDDDGTRHQFIGIVFHNDDGETFDKERIAVITPDAMELKWRGADWFGPALIDAVTKYYESTTTQYL